MQMNILIADDSPTAQASLGELFQLEGFGTSSTSSIDGLFASLSDNTPDILLLNLSLPGTGAPAEVVQRVRDAIPDISIVALADSRTLHAGLETMRSGADDVLPAPANPEQILAAIRHAYEHRQQERVLRSSREQIKRLTGLNQQIIERSPVAIAVLEPDGTVGYINSRMLELLGAHRSKFDWFGTPFTSILEQQLSSGHEEFSQVFERVVTGGRDEHLTAWHVNIASKDIYLDLDVSPLMAQEKDTSSSGVLVVISDVTHWIVDQQLLRSVLKDSTDAIVVTDELMFIRMWSRGAEALFGYTSDDVIGHTLAMLLPHDDSEAFRPLDGSAAYPSEPTRTRRRKKNDEIVDVTLTHSILTDPHGRQLGICEIFRDITGDLKRQQMIEDLKNFYQRIIDTISDGIEVIEADSRRIVLANSARLEWLGANAEDVLGRPADEVGWGVLTDETAPSASELVDSALATGTDQHITIASHRAVNDRQVVWTDLTAFPMTGPDKQSDHIIVVGRDITDRVEMETKQAALRDRRDSFFNAAPVGILSTDSEGRIEFVNPRLIQIFGLDSAESLVGRSIFGLSVVEQMDILDEITKTLIDGIPLTRDNLTCTAPSGRELIANVRAQPFRAPDDQIVGVVAAIEDVTEETILQHNLSATTADLTMLAEVGEIFHESRDSDTIIQAILVGITAGKGLGFNRAFYLQTDPDAGNLRGRLAIGPTSSEEAWETWNELNERPLSLYELVRAYQEKAGRQDFPIDRLAHELVVPLTDVKQIFDDTTHERSAFRLTRQDAPERVPLDLIERLETDSFAVVPLRLDRDVQGVIIVDNAFTSKPITDDDLRGLELFANQAMLAIERARLYSELEQHIQEVREANVRLKQEQELRVHSEKLKAIGKMATHVAHEIRNPMAAIGGFARAILRTLNDEDPNRAFAQIIADETTRLERILVEVLEYSRERPIVAPNPTDCRALLRHIVNVMQDEISGRGATPHVHLPDRRVTIMADPDQISQVLHNLIQNALDALGDLSDTDVDPSSDRAIFVSLETANTTAVVSIADTGTGLNDEAMKRLFDPFYTTKAQGTGLGLAISRQIVANHDGEITVTNNEYGGATFHVALPLHEEDSNGSDTRS